MDADAERIERARAKNLAYIRQKDKHEASQAVDELLAVGSSTRRSAFTVGGIKGNSSIYITGLTTYMACRQLEGACAKLGKVRRIKFYKDERGGLKGDAVVTFSSRATMKKAIDRLNHFEVKPGVIIIAIEATFSSKQVKNAKKSKEVDGGGQATTDYEASAPLNISSADEKPPLGSPSDSVILKNVWGSLDSSDAAFLTELEEDIRVECARHGVVERVQVVGHGSAIVRFAELNAAIACQKVMNGRWFAGRQIEAQFDQATTENLSDADAKIEAFLASIEE
ncbi:unnamed protein product [Peronospora destructor]|uniref:RRM domain-containing protein n=1 Tax=Peronospora destructor TaxID=86335 RepID=A0AAV0U3T0_9STRA|nr:unnamed protein product [Peronospora destructor]CAI5747156.1 unnamed protein product [Peronospora destructor]